MRFFLALATTFAACLAHSDYADTLEHEHWEVHESKLPFAVSDMSATLVDGKIYLMGGCVSGNQRVENEFYCFEVTAALSSFDPNTGAVETLPPAPRKRYRHTAAAYKNLIFFIGGRDDNEDSLVAAIDIFDTEAGAWADTGLTLPEEKQRSDLTSFVIDDIIYVVAGYNPDYTVTTETYSIDPAASLEEEMLVTATQGSINVGRGDTQAAIVGDKAYLVGGFTHEDQWCNALDTVEAFDVSKDAWTEVSGMQYARGDKAVVSVGDRLVVIGGEANTDCTLGAAQRTTPTTEVEVFQNGAWSEEIVDIPSDHFRFTAVSVGNTIYTFGGQGYYDATGCDCFPVRDTIMEFTVTESVVVEDDDDDSGLSTGAIAGIAVAGAVVFIALVAVLVKSLNGKDNIVIVSAEEVRSTKAVN